MSLLGPVDYLIEYTIDPKFSIKQFCSIVFMIEAFCPIPTSMLGLKPNALHTKQRFCRQTTAVQGETSFGSLWKHLVIAYKVLEDFHIPLK